MKYIALALTVSLSFSLAACTTAASAAAEGHKSGAHKAAHDEPRPYDPKADAEIDINTVLVEAKQEDKLGLLVFGANWCHDSRALAAHFEKPRFQTLLRSHYKMTYIDVGQKDRNIDLARKFGVDNIVGTPTIFVTNSDGKVLNLETAPTWRNAASREEDAIFDYFRDFAHPKAPK
ncbi:MAG: thioredoxin family protein [Hellea sp.]